MRTFTLNAMALAMLALLGTAHAQSTTAEPVVVPALIAATSSG